MSKKLIILLGVLGTSFSSVFVTYADAPSSVLAMLRNLFASVALLPLVLLNHRQEMKGLDRKTVASCVVSGVFLALHFSTYFESLLFTSIASSNVLVSTEIFFVGIITCLLFKEKISKAGMLGIAVTFAGSAIVALNDISAGSDALKGDILACVSAMFMAVYTLIGKKQRSTMSATLYTFIVYSSCTAALFIYCVLTPGPVWQYSPINYLMAFGMTLMCTFLGHSIFNWGLKYEKAVFISTAKLAGPIFATILGFLFFRQAPTLVQVLGGMLIIAGLAIYTRTEA